jgi:hypothetical protein
MSDITPWFCNELLKTAFNRDTYVPPYNQLAVCLLTQTPSVNIDPVDLVEPIGGNYGRVLVPYNTANWALSGFREIQNVNAVNFPEASSYWGTVEAYAVITATSGSYASSMTVAVGSMTPPIRVTPTTQVVWDPYTLSFGLYDAP